LNIYNQLTRDYEIEKEKMDKGQLVDKLNLMFVGYALDAVDHAKMLLKRELDFSEESIKDVEVILDTMHKTMERDKPENEQILNSAKMYSGYLGQVIKLRWGGEWKAESEYSFSNGPGIRVKNQDLFLMSKVYRRLVNGAEDNVWHLYQIIKKEIEGNDDCTVIEDVTFLEKKKNWLRRMFGSRF
jgi:hypothetical protein